MGGMIKLVKDLATPCVFSSSAFPEDELAWGPEALVMLVVWTRLYLSITVPKREEAVTQHGFLETRKIP